MAFFQAPIEENVYVRLPRGFEQNGKCLKLLKSVYGLRQSPYNWYQKLKKGLEDRGFKCSQNDPCLFTKNGLACVCYVDDCLWFGRTEEEIDQAIEDLKSD